MYISKRAESDDKIKQIAKTLWKSNRGLFENLFRLAPYVSLFFGIPWWQLIAGTIGMHTLGLSAMDLGRYLDQKLGTTSGNLGSLDDIEKKLSSATTELMTKYEARAAISHREFTKEANIAMALLRSGKLANLFITGIMKLLGGLMALFGLASVDDLIRELTEPVREKLPEIVPEKQEYKKEQLKPTPNMQDKKNNLTTLLDELEQKYKGV